MTLEQYRDMRERAFDRYKLSAQVLEGNKINSKPENQEGMEKEALKKLPGNVKEMYPIVGDYPEIDRTNRHTLASGLVEILKRPASDTCLKECTILSKASSELPMGDQWSELFANPEAADWPDPYLFKPEKYGLNVEDA